MNLHPQISHARDPVTVEVIRNRLNGIANEMEASLIQSSFSTIVKEAGDASAAIFTRLGENLAQAVAQPIHLTTLIPMLAAVIAEHPLETIEPGDLFILNDPYTAGGTHIPDIAVIMPVFVDAEICAFTGSVTHHQDTGGMTIGSTPTNATEIFQEGLRLPVLKLWSAGKPNETLLKMIRLNVRLPLIFEGDLNAQIAACHIGAQRLTELASKYGRDYLLSVFEDLLNKSERLTREAIARIPNGTYIYVDHLDNDGIDDQPIRLQVAIEVENDRIVCDFRGTSRQVRGPFNCVPSGSLSAACFFIRALCGNEIPTNGGCFRPIELRMEKGSLVDPLPPAPVGCRTATVKRLACAMLGALRSAMVELIPADSGSQLLTILIGGESSDGRFAISIPLSSGSGATPRSDGVDVIETDITNTLNLPVESIEATSPLRVNYMRLAENSGGAGQWRGGLGCEMEIEVLDGDLTLTYRGERQFQPASGALGGLAGGRGSGTILRHSGQTENIPSKCVTKLSKGDRLIAKTAGGGGYGDPKLRDRYLVEADVNGGKISPHEAKEIYSWDASSRYMGEVQ